MRKGKKHGRRYMHIYLVIALIIGLILVMLYVIEDRRPLPEPTELSLEEPLHVHLH